MNRIEPKRFVQVCWLALATGGLVGVVVAIFEVQIEANSWLTLLAIAAVLPVGIVQLTLVWQLIEHYRWWCLLILVLLPWPVAFILAALLVPFGFLALITYRIYAHGPETYAD
jgi:hypothetical protein